MKIIGLFLALVIALAAAPLNAQAVPKRIIILRHGEKANDFALCGAGVERSFALAKNYLGKGSAHSLFGRGESPAAFFVITLHTLELVSPASLTWHEPVIDYSVIPLPGGRGISTQTLDQRTREAAENVLTDRRWDGKTVVMIWEHHHIADASLERQSKQRVTLRQLLHLDALGDRVPKTWSGSNYDYFWIVDYGKAGSDRPTAFRAIRQVFPAPFQGVPSNAWNAPEPLPPGSGCRS